MKDNAEGGSKNRFHAPNESIQRGIRTNVASFEPFAAFAALRAANQFDEFDDSTVRTARVAGDSLTKSVESRRDERLTKKVGRNRWIGEEATKKRKAEKKRQ